MDDAKTPLASERGRVASVSKDVTVMEAVRIMVDHKVGSVVIVEGGLLGILSEHDVVSRLVLRRRDPEATAVTDVMRTSFRTVRDDGDRSSVLRRSCPMDQGLAGARTKHWRRTASRRRRA
jgi:CBS domain-containing protein